MWYPRHWASFVVIILLLVIAMVVLSSCAYRDNDRQLTHTHECEDGTTSTLKINLDEDKLYIQGVQ